MTKVYRKKDEPGVSPVQLNGVQPETVLAIMLASTVYEDLGYRFVITDLVAERSSRSFHPVGLAFDLRIWDVPEDKVGELVVALSDALGGEWDVVYRGDHIHCELDVEGGTRPV